MYCKHNTTEFIDELTWQRIILLVKYGILVLQMKNLGFERTFPLMYRIFSGRKNP